MTFQVKTIEQGLPCDAACHVTSLSSFTFELQKVPIHIKGMGWFSIIEINFAIALVLLCFAIGSKKFSQLSQPIRSKTKTNCNLLVRACLLYNFCVFVLIGSLDFLLLL